MSVFLPPTYEGYWKVMFSLCLLKGRRMYKPRHTILAPLQTVQTPLQRALPPYADLIILAPISYRLHQWRIQDFLRNGRQPLEEVSDTNLLNFPKKLHRIENNLVALGCMLEAPLYLSLPATQVPVPSYLQPRLYGSPGPCLCTDLIIEGVLCPPTIRTEQR